VYKAKTYGDLETITRDLPSTSSFATSTVAIGIMSGFERKQQKLERRRQLEA
jgi:hypothetical protein